MQVSQTPSFTHQYQLPTRANTAEEDQLPEIFDMWVENNTGVKEHNFLKTHPEPGQVAFAMIEQASKDIYGSTEEGMVLPGSVIPQAGQKDGQFTVGLHALEFTGDGIVGKEPIAKLTVDTTPGQDGTTYIISTP